MMDFTSSLYLGMRHRTDSIAPWEELTTGKPAVLDEPAAARKVARAFARLQGVPDAFCGTSTLHLYSDLYEYLQSKRIAVFADDAIYPVSLYGLEKLALNRVPIFRFRHQDAGHLSAQLELNRQSGRQPVIVTDGWCPVCGRGAPLRNYAALANSYQGLILLDDTQALGILGRPAHNSCFGYNGGGSIRRNLLAGNKRILVTSSLAKAFGVPLAIMGGPAALIKRIKEGGSTRFHSSPPSRAHLHAAWAVVHLNETKGEQLRMQLLQRIRLFRNYMRQLPVALSGGWFPAQFITTPMAPALQQWLAKQQIKTAVVTDHAARTALCVLLRTDHSEGEIAQLVQQVKHFLLTHGGKRLPADKNNFYAYTAR